jgi:hypothetical protein
VLVAMILAAVAVGAVSRLLPYAVPSDSPFYLYIWNFTPVFALALFAGACLANRWAAFLVPLLAMALSDAVLHATGLAPVDVAGRAVVYGFFALTVGMGFWLRKRRSALAVGGVAVGNALLFYLITNFQVWLTSPDAPLPVNAPRDWLALFWWSFTPEAFGAVQGYPKTWDGLVACFTLALPFLRNMVLGNLVYCAALFGGLALVEKGFPAVRDEALATTTP